MAQAISAVNDPKKKRKTAQTKGSGMVDEMKEINELKQMAAEAWERLDKLYHIASNEIDHANKLADEVLHLEDELDEIEDANEREKLQERIDEQNGLIADVNDSFELYDKTYDLAHFVHRFPNWLTKRFGFDEITDIIETVNDVANYIEKNKFRKLVDVMPENEKTYLIESVKKLERIELERFYLSQQSLQE